MFAFVLLNAWALGISRSVAVVLRRGGPMPGVLLTALCTYLVVVHLSVLASGVLGHLTVGGVAVVLAVFTGAALWLARRAAADVARPAPAAPRFTAAALYPLLVALAGAALWLRQHAVVPPVPAQAFTMQAWYRLGAARE